MASIFKNKSILLALDNPPTSKMLAGILKILQFGTVDTAEDGGQAFRAFQSKSYDIVITELVMSPMDGRYLVNQIRDASSGSPNVNVPVLLNAGQSAALDIESLRADGFTDLLLSPFSFDDVKTRLSYVLENYQEHSAPQAPEPAIPHSPAHSASEAEDQQLVKDLLGHYMDHHEAVLQKLKFAQDATAKSIAEIQDVKQDLANQDNASIASFSKFESMWGEIIEMFSTGGISEDDIFKIESIVTNVPSDIKKHYNNLTQQDKSFLTMIEALNHDGYRKAKQISQNVQSQPNRLTGMTQDDYQAKTTKADDVEFIFRPNKK